MYQKQTVYNPHRKEVLNMIYKYTYSKQKKTLWLYALLAYDFSGLFIRLWKFATKTPSLV